jgi:membrane dipeptidase
MMGDKTARVDIFADLGVRCIQLTYNSLNQLGGGSMDPANTGLTAFGREVVAKLNERRVMVDLSHSGRQICLDAARASTAPISINHTGCQAIVDVPRNKTDEELKLVADRGGFVGIYFVMFVAEGREATIDDVVAHIEHALKVCGEDHVGIGSDYGIVNLGDMQGVRDFWAAFVRRRMENKSAGQGRGSQYPSLCAGAHRTGAVPQPLSRAGEAGPQGRSDREGTGPELYALRA